MADKWTHDLKALDAIQTRKRLADLIFECHYVAAGLEIPQGEGLRDHVTITKLKLERVAKEEITRLSGMLAEYRSGPPVAEPPKAAAEAEPTTARAVPPRPQMPVRGMRLPPRTPGRPA